MDKQIKDLWIAALESGEYRQGVRRLRQSSDEDVTGTFCCLGVLCDLYKKHTGNGHWIKESDDIRPDGVYKWCDGTEADVTFPSQSVIDWAGLGYPQVIIKGTANFLEIHNDAGRTFAEIAKAIREQL